ncbi:MAG: EF-hand domain-containing protein [Roseibacillus sp.]|nr:EF-hand domain-containing protein [Roseibacillus sp.]
MKNTLKLIAAITIAGVGLVAADDKDGDKPKEKPAKKAKGGRGLMSADKNKDGKITLDEMKSWGAAKSKPVPAEKIEALFKKRDKNGDGTLTADEVKGGKKKAKPEGEGKKKKPGAKDGAAS